MVQHHGEDGFAGAVEVGGFKDIVFVFVLRASGDADMLYGLADFLILPALHQTAAGEYFFIIFGQNAFMYDQIIREHCSKSPIREKSKNQGLFFGQLYDTLSPVKKQVFLFHGLDYFLKLQSCP